MDGTATESAKIINFDGRKYRQLTFRPCWTDCEFDVWSDTTGEWAEVSSNDLIWLYDDGWPSDYYRTPDAALLAKHGGQ